MCGRVDFICVHSHTARSCPFHVSDRHILRSRERAPKRLAPSVHAAHIVAPRSRSAAGPEENEKATHVESLHQLRGVRAAERIIMLAWITGMNKKNEVRGAGCSHPFADGVRRPGRSRAQTSVSAPPRPCSRLLPRDPVEARAPAARGHASHRRRCGRRPRPATSRRSTGSPRAAPTSTGRIHRCARGGGARAARSACGRGEGDEEGFV